MDQACALTGRFLGALITVFYGLYFLFICGYNLSFYSAFVSSVMAPKFSLLLLASAVLLTACYGAFRGVEALARASGIIIVIVVACLVFFITALLFKLDPLNYTPLLYDGTDKNVDRCRANDRKVVLYCFFSGCCCLSPGER